MIVDCELHPSLASAQTLLPYLDEYWREMIELRGTGELTLADYPKGLPLCERPEFAGASGTSDPAELMRTALDETQAGLGICLPLFGGLVAVNPHFSAALCKAANDWQAAMLCDRDERLRASIMLPAGNVPAAVREIETRSDDLRFVQAVMFVGSELPLGRMEYSPIYEAAAAARLPIAIHPGSLGRNAPTPSGWPSYLAEHHANLPSAFEAQLLSFISEGVFARFPALKIILLESGTTWLPQFMWRTDKLWKGTRMETPWVDRAPSDIIRSSVFATLTPFDAADVAAGYARLCDEAQCAEMWLHATDFPHWHSDGANPLTALPEPDRRQVASRNPQRAYPRLTEVD